ncbi:calcium-binding protein [Roseovarius phycicola]|uniref:Calcium-binding protein n=1 Tax=Roseovarius phycicola TaxID=3080976 RepID=A0ABZ2HHC0_9RHOB
MKVQDDINGTNRNDRIIVGSGAQNVEGGGGNDRIVSLADAGEPDPAQTDGSDGRVTEAVSAETANDTLTGGDGADRFEFHALIDAKEEVIAQHTNSAGRTNWAKVAGENDNVHDHWVNGFGFDTITDFSKAECDTIEIKGHTATIQSITYGEDEGGAYSLITVISQQGNGGAGGANTATGAHDEDPLGQIKVYGDEVTLDDVKVTNTNDGIDRLYHANAVYGAIDAGVTQEVYTNTDGDNYDGSLYRQRDVVHAGEGSQTIDTGGGNDLIFSYSDGGEPDPAQTDGADGRVNPAIPDGAADDVLAGGQGKDTFAFRLLLNAKEEILEKHTRDDGSVNWRKVAGENDNVHDHWVEGIGNDTILDFSNQDGDKIDIRGHTVEIASITYGEDDGGDFSLITLRSQQGDGGGAHDEDPLGTIKVYGDKVTEDDINVKAKVFYGVDQLDEISDGEATSPASTPEREIVEPQWGAENPESIDLNFEGTSRWDFIKAGSGSQTVNGGAGGDRFISYGDAGEPDPAQTDGADGRVNPALSESASDDVFIGGAGGDRFEFHALLNARAEVLAQHTNDRGHVNWRKVAGENDNVHDHWVEGIGNDMIMDYNKSEGDKIVVRGHTVEIADITYGADEGGEFSLVRIISQQGNGGAGGANTETGAHDEDPLGTIKVYGDKVNLEDIKVQASGVFDGVDRLTEADQLAEFNGGVQSFASSTDGEEIITAPASIKTTDHIEIGAGAQTVFAGAGRDYIRVYADAGEPDPAQTDGAEGRINPPVDPSTTNDVISGGQGKDRFTFNMLLNATAVVLAKHTRDDGTINWRKVAGENDAVHDHWVEGIGNDTLLDFSEQDGDQIILRGHTVEIADITYGKDAGGDYSLIAIRSQQGDGGGAHDEDPLGTLKVYGDTVTQDNVTVQAKGVFDGIDALEPIANAPAHQAGTNDADNLVGTDGADNIHGNRGNDLVTAGDGDDFVFGDGGNDILFGGGGNDYLEGGWGRDVLDGGDDNDVLVSTGGIDVMIGGDGADTFGFQGKSKGGTIVDWEAGVDRIDLSRLDEVDDFEDITITQTSDTAATITFVNDKCQEATVDVFSSSAFELTANDFLI